MFDVGFSEILVIAVVALVVLGPKRLPEAARAAGKWMAKARRFVSEVRHDFDREMRNAEIMELSRIKDELDQTKRALADSSNRMMQDLDAIGDHSIATPAVPARSARRKPGVARKSPSESAPKSAAKTTPVKPASPTRPSHGRKRSK